MKGYPLHCGLDLSGRQDLTSFVMTWDLGGGKIAAKSFFWTPKDSLAERQKRDGAKYVEWEKKGFLRATEGKVVGYGDVVKMIARLVDGHDLQSIAYDSWHIEAFKTEMERAGIDPESWPLHPFAQTFKAFSPAVEKLENLIIEHGLTHDSNPVLTYCMSNVRVTSDSSGNRKFDKRRRNRRIDGTVALTMAVYAMDVAEKVEKAAPSVYERRGLRTV